MVLHMRKSIMPIYIISFVLIIITTFFPQILGQYHNMMSNITILGGIWSIFNIFSTLQIQYDYRTPNILTKSVFFIFAFHTFPLPFVGGSILSTVERLTTKCMLSNSIILQLLELFITPTVIIAACILCYMTFNRLLPKLCSIMIGNR